MQALAGDDLTVYWLPGTPPELAWGTVGWVTVRSLSRMALAYLDRRHRHQHAHDHANHSHTCGMNTYGGAQ